MKIPALYWKHHVNKDYTSIGLFRELKKKFKVSKVFYPGSHVHITASLVFSNVIYSDSFRNTFKFFENPEVLEFIKKHKEYSEEAAFKFYQQDYYKPFLELTTDFDLIISQYASFVGQAVKSYLKKGGLLVCNNSHGDASMASLDTDYQLIAVYRRKSDEQFSISDKNLKDYLIPKRGIEPIKVQLAQSMKGMAYTKSPSGYVFQKIK